MSFTEVESVGSRCDYLSSTYSAWTVESL